MLIPFYNWHISWNRWCSRCSIILDRGFIDRNGFYNDRYIMGMYIYIYWKYWRCCPPQTLYLHLTYGPFGGFTMARTGHISNDSSVGFPAGWLHWLVDPLFYLDSVEFPWKKKQTHMDMDQYLLIPFLGGWTSIYQLFWCSPGVQGFDTLPYVCSH